MFAPSDLPGVEENLARKLLVYARSIAPIDAIPDGDDRRKDVIAIILEARKELPRAGDRRTRSMARNGTSKSFDIAAAFSDEDRAGLRAACAPRPEATTPAALPQGSFPRGGGIGVVWREGEYT